MDACSNHPEFDAIESCEVCQSPLCGLCLWYTADGHRLCETHAQERELAGEVVLSPETYSEALPNSLRSRSEASSSSSTSEERTLYKGNSYDITALIAAVIGLVTMASCFGGFYCMPLVGLVMGLIAFLNADRAVDRKRTRNLATVSIAVMALFLLSCLGFFLIYFGSIAVFIAANP